MKVKINDKKIDDFHWILVFNFQNIVSGNLVVPLRDRQLEGQLRMMTEKEVREKADEFTK
jgi:hypothetical protein